MALLSQEQESKDVYNVSIRPLVDVECLEVQKIPSLHSGNLTVPVDCNVISVKNKLWSGLGKQEEDERQYIVVHSMFSREIWLLSHFVTRQDNISVDTRYLCFPRGLSMADVT